METFSTLNLWLESKNDTVPYTSNSKSPYQENVANKSTTLMEPSDSATTTSDSTYALTKEPDVNSLLAAAIGQHGDNHIAWDLISGDLNVVNEWLKLHVFGLTLPILNITHCLFEWPYYPSWPLL